MSAIEPEIQEKMMLILKSEEEKTDLENLSVLSRVGMKVASAFSAELDADATSASSTALIDLGLRLSEATEHGALKEIILHNVSGYSILMAVNDEYIVFGALSNAWRIAYYLGYLRELAKKLNILISGGEITEMTLTLQEEELEKLRKQKEIEEAEAAKAPLVPSVEEDKAALDDLLGFLDDWEKEDASDFEELEPGGNIVGIPGSGGAVGIPKAGESVGIPETGGTVGIPTSESGVDISMEDLKELEEISASSTTPQEEFKVYPDEVPPVPLEDYTPMEIEEEAEEAPIETTPAPSKYEYPASDEELDQGLEEELPPLDELPSFDELEIPDFDAEVDSASEYEVEFILDEESESLDSVLKDLGWEEED